MAFKHHLDPPTQWAAGATAGKLVAQGVLDGADIVGKLVEAAVKAGYKGDLRGLRVRMTWQVADNANAWGMQRDRTDWTIRRGISDLLAQWAEPITILRHAHHINEQAGEPLLRSEVKRLVAEEMTEALKRRARSRRRVG